MGGAGEEAGQGCRDGGAQEEEAPCHTKGGRVGTGVVLQPAYQGQKEVKGQLKDSQGNAIFDAQYKCLGGISLNSSVLVVNCCSF